MITKKVLNKAEVAALLCVSQPRIIDWVNHYGMPCRQKGRKGVEWQFVHDDVMFWYTTHIRDKGKESKNDAQLRKAQADATLAELQVQQKLGELVPIDDIAKIVADEYANVRARLLSIPTKLAPALYTVDDLMETQAILEQGMDDVLKELTADKNAIRSDSAKKTNRRSA